MTFSLRRKNVSRWLAAVIVPASFAPLALADGLIDSNIHWDTTVQPVSHRHDCPCPPVPCTPCQPESAKPEGTSPDAVAPEQTTDEMDYTGPDVTSRAALASSTSSFVDPNGYLDIARIASRVRVRYDDMQNNNAPTRAEFFYPTLGIFGGPGPVGGGGIGVPSGGNASEVDMRDLSTYIEVAFGPRFSVFGDFSARWVDDVNFPTTFPGGIFDNGTQVGAGDFRAGLRYGLIATSNEWLTAQVRAWAPTGDARRALGVGHSSIDVALLYQTRTSCRATFWAEIDDWQSIDAGTAETFPGSTDPTNVIIDLDANVLRYGLGFGYDLWQSCQCRPQTFTAVFEVVGWTVLDGFITPTGFPTTDGGGNPLPPPPFIDAEGDTIVNGKYGLRYSWDCCCHQESVYFGYGHNWTDERWYSDIFRLEWTHYF